MTQGFPKANGAALILFVLAFGVGLTGLPVGASLRGSALAETHEEGGGSGKGKGPGGSGGHEDGGHEEGGDEGSGHGGGHEGGGEGSGGQGNGQGSQGQGGEGGRGGGTQGRPPWAKEGLPEVELGRLNVARSPEQVISRAYYEALSSFTQQKADFYSLSLVRMIEELSLNRANVSMIDSPLQNLALFRDALDGTSVLRTVGVNTANETLLAVFLGTAADKTVPISTDTVIALTTIMGQPISAARASAIAESAERIRIAILAGHG